jgi:hypothetical protein
VDPLRILRHDPADREHADCCQQNRQGSGGAGSLRGRVHPDDQRDDERRAEHRADEPDRLREHVDQREPLAAEALILLGHHQRSIAFH